MLEKEFDRLVKDSLTDHVSEVPGDMWSRVHEQDKRRRALLFWRFTGGGLLLIALLLTGATYFFHRPAPAPATAPTAASPARTMSANAPIATPLRPAHAPATPASLAATPAKTATATDANPSSPASPSAATPARLAHAPTRLVHTPAALTAARNTPAAARNTPAATATRPARSTSATAARPARNASATATRPVHAPAAARPARTTPAAAVARPARNTPAATATRQAEAPATASTATATRPAKAPVATNNTTYPVSTTISTERRIAPAQLARIPAFNNGISARAPHSNAAISTASLPKPKTQTQQPLDNWQLDLYGSPAYLFSEFRSGLSYAGAIRLTKVFHSGFNVSVGIEYSRFNLITQKDSTKFTGTHYLKTLDLPVLAGYSWGNARFRMGVSAGLVLNLHTWSEASQTYATLNPSSQYYSLAPSSSTTAQPQRYLFKFDPGISSYLGFNLSNNLGHGFSLFAEPYLRHTLSGPKIKVYPGISGITAAGLSIGLRRQF